MYVQIVIPQARVLFLIYTPRGHHVKAPTNIVLIKTHMHACTHMRAHSQTHSRIYVCNMRCCLIDDQQSLVLAWTVTTILQEQSSTRRAEIVKTHDQDSKSVTDYTHTVC